MSYPTAQRYINITSCTVGGSFGVNTITRIDVRVETKEIAGAGDADTTDTFLARGRRIVRGTIHLDDPVQAHSLLSQTGDLVFTGLNPNTSKVYTRTVNGAQFFNEDGSQEFEAIGKSSVSFRGFTPGGGDGAPATST